MHDILPYISRADLAAWPRRILHHFLIATVIITLATIYYFLAYTIST